MGTCNWYDGKKTEKIVTKYNSLDYISYKMVYAVTSSNLVSQQIQVLNYYTCWSE